MVNLAKRIKELRNEIEQCTKDIDKRRRLQRNIKKRQMATALLETLLVVKSLPTVEEQLEAL